jgi:SAM-dependent methyltransferase
MLAQARARGIAIALDQVRLQELRYPGAFDVVLCIDAMENIPPEDWPLVLANLHQAMRPGGLLYLTVEEVANSVIEDTFAALTGRGVPAARGEVIDGNVAGYHDYPGRDRVTSWTQDAGLQILDEDFQQQDGWGYRHFLLHTAAGPEPARSLPILATDADAPSAAQDRAKSRRTAPATPGSGSDAIDDLRPAASPGRASLIGRT